MRFFFFLLLQTAKAGHSAMKATLFKGVQVFFKRQRSLQCCHSIPGSVDPRALLCPWTCFSHLLSYSVQSPEMWSWVFLSVGEVTPANSVFPAGAFRISVFPVVQAAEGWVLGAACPDALLNVLAHTMLTTATLCRLSLRFHVLAHMKSLVYKPVSRHFN